MTPTTDRRAFLLAAATAPLALAASDDGRQVIDTHQHLWDLKKFTLPWLTRGTPLARNFTPADYAAAVKGLPITKSVYLEVDVTPAQHDAEADYVADLCASGRTPTRAAVIGGRPESDGFAKYAKRFKDHKSIRGVRRVLHGDGTPPGHCLGKTFVQSVRLLGELGLHFEFCVRHAELPDCAKLADECPGTRFVLDHCGNPDLKKHEKWKKECRRGRFRGAT